MEKLLWEPSSLQFLVVADCLEELGFVEQAVAMRLGFCPEVCGVTIGGSKWGSRDYYYGNGGNLYLCPDSNGSGCYSRSDDGGFGNNYNNNSLQLVSDDSP